MREPAATFATRQLSVAKAATPDSCSRLSGWGKVPELPGVEIGCEDLRGLAAGRPRLARGLGRAYGDAALPATNDTCVVNTCRADRIVGFDEQTGVLCAEAGLSLDAICRLFLPRGYFTPVSPGTRFVTLGGMVACDVHGKNHHVAGTFGQHLRGLTIRLADNRILRCSPSEHPELFWATIGGMGLTGIILEVEVALDRLPSSWIVEERSTVRDVHDMIEQLMAAASRWPMTVAWIDCLASGRASGRGVLIRGRWAAAEEVPARLPRPGRPLSVPFDLPRFALSAPAVRAFNTAYYHSHRRHGSRVVHPYTFFYPLDAIHNWRRLYGRSGFVQYQCVLPTPHTHEAAQRILDVLNARGGTSFLCVVKDCGAEGRGLLSFPRPGISMALDIPYRPTTQALIDILNEEVIAAGGRIYLAKDAMTRPEHFRAMEPRLPRFLEVRRAWDPEGWFRSAQSVRLFGW